jgi:hypothetical protein
MKIRGGKPFSITSSEKCRQSDAGTFLIEQCIDASASRACGTNARPSAGGYVKK